MKVDFEWSGLEKIELCRGQGVGCIFYGDGGGIFYESGFWGGEEECQLSFG